MLAWNSPQLSRHWVRLVLTPAGGSLETPPVQPNAVQAHPFSATYADGEHYVGSMVANGHVLQAFLGDLEAFLHETGRDSIVWVSPHVCSFIFLENLCILIRLLNLL